MKTSPRSKTPPAFFSPQVLEARRFYLDLAPPASKPLAVVCGGCECCAPDYAIHRSTFPYYSIELVVRGRGRSALGGQESSLLPGAVFSYGPGVAQDITTETADPLVKYFVDFTGRAGARLLRQYALGAGQRGARFRPRRDPKDLRRPDPQRRERVALQPADLRQCRWNT